MTTLTVSHLTKKYRKFCALDDVSVTLEDGVYGLLGPNGAGKTTLIRAIAGIQPPDSGTVTWNGTETGRLGNSYYDNIGYMPQYPRVYPHFTGKEMMRYMAELKGGVSEKKISELLDFVNLTAEADKKVGAYSGGMRQRLGIAAALLNEPKLLILDEPTAGLDPIERIRFRNTLARIRSGRIILLATHIVPDVESLADRILLLGAGKLLRSGTAGDLCGELDGQVWEFPAQAEQLPEILQTMRVSSVKGENPATVRAIAEEAPVPDAASVTPTLDDVFLHHFGGAVCGS